MAIQQLSTQEINKVSGGILDPITFTVVTGALLASTLAVPPLLLAAHFANKFPPARGTVTPPAPPAPYAINGQGGLSRG